MVTFDVVPKPVMPWFFTVDVRVSNNQWLVLNNLSLCLQIWGGGLPVPTHGEETVTPWDAAKNSGDGRSANLEVGGGCGVGLWRISCWHGGVAGVGVGASWVVTHTNPLLTEPTLWLWPKSRDSATLMIYYLLEVVWIVMARQ
ncbi:hypothetical protein RIF29_22241 [Crotalaria pallida]|uniref:Uncharacterized protein n=1 Tax=Crotalaria pallida TaxID=3830 RepID=A0AAN9F6S3_CROPI